MSTRDPFKIRYSFGLDLMRATAVLLVMISHWANSIGIWFHLRTPSQVFFAGDVGVHLFFALSGFLIGRILINIAQTAPTSRNYGIFIVRRAMRTLPLYFIWLAALMVFWPPHHEPLAVALRLATLTQNLFAPMPPDFYFAVSWSLTVEEWFYLLFGAMLIFATVALASSARALRLCLAVFLLVPLVLRLSMFGWDAATWAMSKQVFFRIDEIAYGVLMAALFNRRSWLFRYPVPPLLLGVSLIALTWSDRLPLPINLLPALSFNAVILGCALCLPAALHLSRVPSWIARTVHWVSSRSYALYIVHLTIIENVVQDGLLWPRHVTAPVAATLAVVLPFLVAELSYRCLESPILRRRPHHDLGAATKTQILVSSA